MFTIRRIVAASLAGLAFAAGTAGAQAQSRAQAREGFWIGFGVGASNNDLECTGCAFSGPSDPWRGGLGSSAYLALGSALSPQLLLGGEGNASVISGSDREAAIASLLFVVQYYPATFEGFHVKGGMGPSAFRLESDGGSVEATGFAIRAGVGYDFRINRTFAITPYANIARTMVQQGSLSVSGTAGPVTRIENRMVSQFGLGFHWY